VFFFVLIKKMLKKLINIFILLILTFTQSGAFASNSEFNIWVKNFKTKAVKSGVSRNVVEEVMSNAIFLPKVIKYDRFQPEFYEDTYTYIKKRTNKNKVKKGLALYKKEKLTIDKIEKEFFIEKELLLALMGIETNFGKYLGKMDIVSSLATLSFDKRRSEFFTKELIILLKLVDQQIIDKKILFGSWAGAFGNFQFMPRTIRNYAIDYNKNTTIELKKTEDSFASAANYLNKIGWKKNTPCFIKINLSNNTPDKYLNSSAGNIKNKKKVQYFKKYIKNYKDLKVDKNLEAAIITPDKDIIPGANTYTPAYLIFANYEKILNWNRSLRFALAVCTLKNNFENEI
jgi:membrane-bound lytic murein transglycosylase B